ncbi:hypothetical protein XF35_40090 [Streptomyces platensis subsp. clarensis]|uniref:Uncharacterized protein n=1 Tax=Streptomyces showdoensis TaxID=68268 RepID=A0A2P2GS80_STREW|nr:hypothetical protein [Streptomyces showdoensis]KKZ74344.1 hypothetical protein VO63_07815 [Streptomyces showdoensis]MCW7991243.1 hypothetical protein [Streptomyces platensis subsp. clarensis]
MDFGIRAADADRAVTAAERRNLPVPNSVSAAREIRAAVSATSQLPDLQRPSLPNTAAKTTAVIQAHAEALRLADVTRRAADLFTDEADQRYVDVTRAAIPAWIAGLQKEFAALVGVVTKAAAKLPESIDHVDSGRLDWNNPIYSTAYTKAEGAVAQLEQLIHDRADMVKVAGGDGGRDNALFAVAALPEPTIAAVMADDWQRLNQGILQWRDLKQSPVARWVYLVRQTDMTLSLATPGEVRQRSGQVERWREAGHARRSGMTLRGGQAAAEQYLAETA